MARFQTTEEIIAHIRGKFPELIFEGAGYSKADMIADLEEIERRITQRINRLAERVGRLEAQNLAKFEGRKQ